MGKFYFAFAWDIIVNLHVCICKNKICTWSDQGVNLPICKYTPVCICVRMRHLLTPSKICTLEYIYTCVFLAHANWTLVTCKLVFAHLRQVIVYIVIGFYVLLNCVAQNKWANIYKLKAQIVDFCVACMYK